MTRMYATAWMNKALVQNANAQSQEDLQSIIIKKIAFFDVQLTEDTEDMPAKPVLEFDLKVWMETKDVGSIIFFSTDDEGSMKKVANHEKEVFEYQHKALSIEPEKELYGGALITDEGKVAIVIDQFIAPGNTHEFEMPIKLVF